MAPTWSPDGKFIAFRVSRDVRSDIWMIDANGGNPWQVGSATSSPTGPYFSPDGRAVYWIGRAPAGNDRLLRTALSDTGRAAGDPETILTFTGRTVTSFSIAPDGMTVLSTFSEGSPTNLFAHRRQR